ncbi:50S ribosomal protein L2 [Candidatus Nomurabacteria bacterium RIFCSPLOWO2_01_FULL_36_10b]|uniref:Large ribosomal subunit protein uL2 n=1 Tax=Candidatus Nomurabacteria bacterium RIFCSPLOWO2_01_FULL_36_10b TaxID=1801766 RepID=A0A1F6WPC8_9BACT|nr:MAG: 50S ribosomal protein L2 [Candidatus Nomurabacteria bacterium RIFCSPLOWO2_01_FULL_36_10b]
MKRFKPTTPGRRGMTSVPYKGTLTTSTPHKSLTRGRKRNVGRNNQGRITTPHKGSGHKRLYREIDFLYDKINIPAKFETIEYDPNRSSYIALALYADGERRYVIAPKGVSVGDKFIVNAEASLNIGNRMMLRNIPVGTFVYNVEAKSKGGAKLGRSAGNYIQVSAHDGGMATLRMPSSETRKVPDTCFACIGEVSNPDWKLTNLGKAGRNRWRGVRPTVRGSAMNPVDHPHGGGEGRQGIGLRRGPKTRHGKLAYGVKTRRPKKYSNTLILARRKTKRNPQ